MQQQEITGSCSFEPNSTKALKCLVSYITLTGFRMTSTEKRGRKAALFHHVILRVKPEESSYFFFALLGAALGAASGLFASTTYKVS